MTQENLVADLCHLTFSKGSNSRKADFNNQSNIKAGEAEDILVSNMGQAPKTLHFLNLSDPSTASSCLDVTGVCFFLSYLAQKR